MEMTPRKLKRLRIAKARPKYPLDQELVRAAAAADANDGTIYSLLVANPASQYIYRYLTEFVAAVLQEHTGKNIKDLAILDWGGGKGYVSYFLAKMGARATLYETDDFAHTALWRKFKLDARTSDGDKMPFKAKTFDAVISFGVLEHVPYDQQALYEVNRVLKDDGLFFCFNLPNRHSYVHKLAQWRGARYHDRLYGRKETRALLKRAGFNPIGKIWFRQLLPKTHYHYRQPKLFENLDLFLTNYTPLCFSAASIEFVARKQHTYTSVH